MHFYSMALFYCLIVLVIVAKAGGSQHMSNQHNNARQMVNSVPLEQAPNISALYIRHSDEPNEDIHMTDWFWQMLKEDSKCAKRESREQQSNIPNHGTNQSAFYISVEGKTNEPITFNAWAQKIFLNPSGGSLHGFNVSAHQAAYVNSSHASHVGVPEPIFVSEWFATFLSNPKSVYPYDIYNNSAAFFVRNANKTAEEIYLNEWFWNILKFRR